jgi:hypothetical protein
MIEQNGKVAMTNQPAKEHRPEDHLLRWTAVLFGAAVALHATDHLRRGMHVIPTSVFVVGVIQLVLAAGTIALVFAGHRWAPPVAMATGFLSAASFAAAHLLPPSGFFSDSFIMASPAARVTTFSWTSAILEIAADLVLGVVAIAALRVRRRRPVRVR